jgi:drug/metabolite transporter superfamily protein YnfA
VNEKGKESRTYTYFGGIIILDSLILLATLHRSELQWHSNKQVSIIMTRK